MKRYGSPVAGNLNSRNNGPVPGRDARSDSPESRYVRDCVTCRLIADTPLPPLPRDADWGRVYDLAVAEGVAGLLYVLGRDRPGLWPQDFRDRLRESRYRALLRGDRCAAWVRTVLGALSAAQIPVVVLKGWALIELLHEGDMGRREFEDIDLLVLPRDAERSESILQSLGYCPALDEPWPGYERRFKNLRAYLPPAQAVSFGKPFSIGLHWGLLDTPFYQRYVAVERLFERAKPLAVAGMPVAMACPEDHLVYACGHLALHHSYDPALLRYYETAAILRREGAALDWDAILARAREWRLVQPVRHVLARAEALWPGTIPGRALEAVAALRPGRTERWVHDAVVRYRENHTVRTVLAWLTMPGVGRRLRFFWETGFPNEAYMRRRYGTPPGGVWPLLYLRRMFMGLKYSISE